MSRRDDMIPPATGTEYADRFAGPDVLDPKLTRTQAIVLRQMVRDPRYAEGAETCHGPSRPALKRVNKAVARALESRGLVAVDRGHVTLTPAGYAVIARQDR